jgi:mannosyltransferase
MAFAVLSSYLLCRAITSGNSVKNWWIAYAAVLAVMGWANLMSLLIIPAHALTVNAAIRKKFVPVQSDIPSPSQPQSWFGTIISSRKVAISWLMSVMATVLAVIPLMIFAWPQRDGTTRFLAITSVSAVADMPGRLAGSWEVLPVALLLVVMALRADMRRASAGWLCLPWLIIPPIVLLAAGALSPLYDPRYILFCVPALAILAGVGLDALISGIATKCQNRRGNQKRSISSASLVLRDAKFSPALGVVAGAVLIGAIGVPSQLAYRAPDGHGDNIRLAAQIVAKYERQDDAVLYQPPWWRQIAAAYPFGFNHLRDVSLAKTPDQAGNFTGIQLPVSQIRRRLRTTQRVWLVEFMTFHPDPVLATGWKVVMHWHPSTFVLVLYQRQGFTPAAHPH